MSKTSVAPVAPVAIVAGVGLLMAGALYPPSGRLHAGGPRAATPAATAQPRQAQTQRPSASHPASLTVAPDTLNRLNRALLDKYCITCHSDRVRTAGLTLEKADVANVGENPDVWEKVVRQLRSGVMPPAGRPRPEQPATVALVSSLETALDRAAAARPNPGRPGIHRLNRAEYANAIRDMLALEIDGRSFLPGDDADQNGFDNMADALSVSPALVDRYMSAARRISRLAIGRAPLGPVVETYNISRMLYQDDRMSEDLPFGSRGGAAIRHHFPVDGEYGLKIKLQTNLYDYIRGLGLPHQLEVRLDGARIRVFTVGGENHGKVAAASFAGAIFGDPEWEKYTHEADAALEVRFLAKAGTRIVGISFVGEAPAAPEGVLQPRQVGYPLAINETTMGKPAVENVAIGGPYRVEGPGATSSRRQVFVCRPTRTEDEEPCARKILSTLARHAYRRPVTDKDLQTLLGFYKSGRLDGGEFEAGIELALQRILADPDFLFRIEAEPANGAPGAAYRISDLELASRLSFFLWSSIPDDELLDLAIRNRLKNPVVLEQQVRRMFADPRARKALVDNFAGQWLELRNLQGVSPDPDLFKNFDENLRGAFQRETELFVDSQLRQDRSVVELLTANYTYLNEQLATYYGIPNVYGSRFRPVTLAKDQPRAGLLGQGSILSVTSYPNRTAPTIRGKWLLTNILGTPPKPPPPNVPTLKDKSDTGKLVSIRERLEAHRLNPACSTCHSQMDPLGFALENFDATGQWRTIADGAPVDASGVLNGSQFDGPAGLRQFLLSRRQQFVGTVTEKLLMYALGRGIESYDRPVIRKITREGAANDYRWSSIILGIVKSTPFQMRRSES